MELRPIHHWLAESLKINTIEPPFDPNEQFLVEAHKTWQNNMNTLMEAGSSFENVILDSILYAMENNEDFKNKIKSFLK